MPRHAPDHRSAAGGAAPGRYGALITRAAWPDPIFLDDLKVILQLASDDEAQRWLERSRLPTLSLGGKVAVRREALLAALAAQEVARA